jgi:prepilin-type processing-associated H-X9-DG protein
MGALTTLDEDILVISEDPCDSGVKSESLPSVDEDILVISDEPPSGRGPRRRWRAVRAVGLGGALAAASWILIYGIISPAVRASRREECVRHLKRIGLAFHEYHEVEGHFPAPALAGRDGKPLLSWRVAILPQLGYHSLYARFHLDEPWDSQHNRALLREMPKDFACPEGPGSRSGQTGCLVVVGPKHVVGSVNTAFEPKRGADISEFFDGTSNTVLVIETDTPIPWTKPEDLQWTPGGPLPRLASPHDGGANSLFADGSVRFLKSSIAATSLLAILTKNGGEVISSA